MEHVVGYSPGYTPAANCSTCCTPAIRRSSGTPRSRRRANPYAQNTRCTFEQRLEYAWRGSDQGKRKTLTLWLGQQKRSPMCQQVDYVSKAGGTFTILSSGTRADATSWAIWCCCIPTVIDSLHSAAPALQLRKGLRRGLSCMRGNLHVQSSGEGRSVMAVYLPTASLTRVTETPPAAMQAGFFNAGA